jgi:hypothetical protein
MQRRTTEKELAFFVNKASRKHPRQEIILLGDLNRDLNEAQKLATKLNMRLCLSRKKHDPHV